MTPVAAILPAAGQGRRMGANQNKLFLPLNDSSVLEETLRKVISHPQICHIYLVYAQEDQESLNSLRSLPDLTLVLGGERRQDSVAAALAQIQTDRLVEKVIVHDAARPLCSTELISRVIRALEHYPAVIPVIPLKDTIRQINGEQVKLVNRQDYVATQTPQGFHLSPYWQATLQSQQEDWEVTDDASLLEKTGIPVHLIPGEETNLKITTPLDLEFARFLSNHSFNQ
ncbi:MAG: 2-C-methyl-D-erythritol 4-phosphate cytidylyltransferase [bacterium]|jgi:2-C-methyl-D-erythritol 4-phosphate cytidylyltransferase